MALFNTHLGGGVLWGAAVGLLAVSRFDMGPIQAAATGIVGCVGALLPDLDSDTSRPIHILFGVLGVLLPFVAVMKVYSLVQIDPDLVIVILVSGYLVIFYPVRKGFETFTVHRGAFHSLPAAVIAFEAVYLLWGHLSGEKRFLVAAAAGGGYLLHLILDEMSAFGWRGLIPRRKSSAGTAMDLGADKTLSTALLYAALVGLAVWIFVSSP